MESNQNFPTVANEPRSASQNGAVKKERSSFRDVIRNKIVQLVYKLANINFTCASKINDVILSAATAHAM